MNLRIDWSRVRTPLTVWTVTIVFILDQLTKWAVIEYISMGDRVQVMPYFDLVHTKNRGAAFGMFHESTGLFRLFFFGGVTILCLYLLLRWLSETPLGDKFSRFLLSLILGGALGNLLDRIVFGEVTDFVDWYYGSYHWPAFNIADSAITVGATWFVLQILPWDAIAKKLKLKRANKK